MVYATKVAVHGMPACLTIFHSKTLTWNMLTNETTLSLPALYDACEALLPVTQA